MFLAILLAIAMTAPAAHADAVVAATGAAAKTVSPRPSRFLADSLDSLISSEYSPSWKLTPNRLAFERLRKIAKQAVKSQKLSTRKGTHNDCLGEWSRLNLYANGVEAEIVDAGISAVLLRDSSLKYLGLSVADSVGSVTRKFGAASATKGKILNYRSTQPGVEPGGEDQAPVWNLYLIFQKGRLLKAVLNFSVDDC